LRPPAPPFSMLAAGGDKPLPYQFKTGTASQEPVLQENRDHQPGPGFSCAAIPVPTQVIDCTAHYMVSGMCLGPLPGRMGVALEWDRRRSTK
jgi:hypothetical protein